jgi:putative inorganic carbon (HCO3(-)) transporter
MLCVPVSISGSQVGLGLAVLGGIWESARRRTLIRTPLDGPILALLSVSLLSALLSEDPANSAKKLAGSWSILTLYLAVGWYGAPESLARILRWFLPTAVVFGAYGVIQHFTGWNAFRAGAGTLHTLELAGRTVYFPRGGFSHYQTYANVFFMLFCLAGALALGSAGRPRIVRGAIAALLGIVVFMTFTRGIWLSLVAALAIFTWIYARRAAPAIIGIGAAAVLLVLFVPSSLRSRVLSMSDTGVNVERLLLWETTWNMLRDRPLLGVGVGNYRKAQDPYVRDAVPLTMTRTHAHNIWLQAAAERGVLGLLALLWLSVALLRAALLAVRRLRPGGGLALALATGALAALVGFFVDGFVQNNFGDSQAALLFWLVAAVVVVCARAPAAASSSPPAAACSPGR